MGSWILLSMGLQEVRKEENFPVNIWMYLWKDFLIQWREVVERVSNLFARFDTRQAEVAATVHYTASTLGNKLNRAPFAREVLEAVEQWKIRRKPPFKRDDISQAIVSLATRGWVEVVPDASVDEFLDRLALL